MLADREHLCKEIEGYTVSLSYSRSQLFDFVLPLYELLNEPVPGKHGQSVPIRLPQETEGEE